MFFVFVGEIGTSPEIRSDQKIDNQIVELLRCDACGVNFIDKTAKSVHDVDIHHVVAFCGTCQKGFKSMLGYKYHIKQHNISFGKTNDCYECRTCGNFYPNPSRLRQHMRCHSEMRPYTCRKCGRSYKHNNGLKIHTCNPMHLLYK